MCFWFPRNKPKQHYLYFLQRHLHPTVHASLFSFNRQPGKNVCQEKTRCVDGFMVIQKRKSKRQRTLFKKKDPLYHL